MCSSVYSTRACMSRSILKMQSVMKKRRNYCLESSASAAAWKHRTMPYSNAFLFIDHRTCPSLPYQCGMGHRDTRSDGGPEQAHGPHGSRTCSCTTCTRRACRHNRVARQGSARKRCMGWPRILCAGSRFTPGLGFIAYASAYMRLPPIPLCAFVCADEAGPRESRRP